MPFSFKRLDIYDVILIEPRVFRDERGFFMESYKHSEFAAFGIKERFVQDNHSRSRRGVLRGLHYQNPPRAQGKLVRAVSGEIFDVAVDIRRGSPTYGRWVGVNLSEENMRMLYIPPGFAHGFMTLSDVADVMYKTTDEYSPEHEAGIIWNDPGIGIEWPASRPVLSPRDAKWPGLRDAVNGFVYEGR
ncbi:dTDP-4-dehydrorhamnose 3,5-epimerase [Methanothrix thermoacetophila]|uniref:dTDP-4-dehydrorhamnose 3,5-epimerase n=1 Tax=Methanothrix thermoacetophila (strain DSM 6194 / JCM 14653 / NBRC 101360 / PT) TaxID=349307 RepID=A0B7R9_METTP|nr:dTDP-4-dehydrorhamnose 3,5-epimerase [Methanothrix thermoacetophila]ABK14743.1 dTDP-4-dehydrorhamnose 3,5-epimerase [Methanothrix thermoacetophila PT]